MEYDNGEEFYTLEYHGTNILIHIESMCAKSMKYPDLTIDSSDLNLNYYKYKYDEEGYVYMLKYPEYVKIGKTQDINKRYSSYDREN